MKHETRGEVTPLPGSRDMPGRILSPGSAMPANDVATGDPREIDLIQLLRTLWRGRRLLAAVTLGGVLMAAAAGLLYPYRWTSTAEVVAPTEVEMASLVPLLTQMNALGVTPVVDGAWLYRTFIQVFSAGDARMAWLKKSDSYRALSPHPDDTATRAVLQGISRDITLTDSRQDKKTQRPYDWLTLSARGDSARQAQRMLDGWMTAAARDVSERARRTLTLQLRDALQSRREAYRMAWQEEMNALAVKQTRLAYALELARAAGISRPVFSRGMMIHDDPDFPVQLGSAGLAQKQKILRSIHDPLQMSADLMNRQRQLVQLAALTVPPLSVTPYHILSRPGWPLRHDGPRLALLLVLGGLLGGLGGCALLLLRDALRDTDAPRTKTTSVCQENKQ